MKNIVLIGFMGSGKSFVGKELAKVCNMQFLDMDTLIEEKEQKKIRDIFADKGEQRFRELEKELFKELCSTKQNCIVSTGGGAPTVIENLKELGTVIYLSIGFDDLLERLKADEFDKRPLFQNIEFARELFNKREPIYKSKADFIINSMQDVAEIVKQIRNVAAF